MSVITIGQFAESQTIVWHTPSNIQTIYASYFNDYYWEVGVDLL